MALGSLLWGRNVDAPADAERFDFGISSAETAVDDRVPVDAHNETGAADDQELFARLHAVYRHFPYHLEPVRPLGGRAVVADVDGRLQFVFQTNNNNKWYRVIAKKINIITINLRRNDSASSVGARRSLVHGQDAIVVAGDQVVSAGRKRLRQDRHVVLAVDHCRNGRRATRLIGGEIPKITNELVSKRNANKTVPTEEQSNNRGLNNFKRSKTKGVIENCCSFEN